MAGSMKVMAEERGASVSFRAEGPADDAGRREQISGPVLVTGDEFKIEEVLSNYLSNAVHHVDQGGRIQVTVQDNGSTVRTHVFNTGSCIPEEDIGHIWDKFYKVDKAHTRTYGGTGIGLSIVKAVMEAHSMGYGVRNVLPEEVPALLCAEPGDGPGKFGGVDFWFDLPKGEETAS